MIWRGQVTTDANGLFMYDPTVFRAAYGTSLRDGRNLLQEYLSDDSGDEALRSGLVVPILAIDADTYSVTVSTERIRSTHPSWRNAAEPDRRGRLSRRG